MREIHPLTAGVLFYAACEIIRNAARYGRPADRPLNLRIGIEWQDGAEIAIEDDGVGLEGGRTSDEGSGQGLALHSTMLAVIGGTLTVESVPNAYTRVTLRLPQTAN
jgi:signal transduction histidine kinase